MSRHIVAAVDYSSAASEALRAAGAGASGDRSRLSIVHVLPGEPPQADPSNVWKSGEDAVRRERLRLESLAERELQGTGVAYEIEVLWGDTIARLRAYLREAAADRVYVGAVGTGAAPDAALGPVAAALLRDAPCAVVVVQPRRETAPVAPSVEAAPAHNVGAVVRRAPVTISQEDNLAAAQALMDREGVHQLPVVQDGLLIGIVAARDLNPHIGYFERTKVDAVMTRAPLTISVSAAAQEAARVLIDHNLNALPVLDGRRLVGMVSKTDLLRLLIEVLDASGASH